MESFVKSHNKKALKKKVSGIQGRGDIESNAKRFWVKWSVGMDKNNNREKKQMSYIEQNYGNNTGAFF